MKALFLIIFLCVLRFPSMGQGWQVEKISMDDQVYCAAYTPRNAGNHIAPNSSIVHSISGGASKDAYPDDNINPVDAPVTSPDIIALPNRAASRINLLYNASAVHVTGIKLLSADGQAIRNFAPQEKILYLDDLEAGVYVLSIATDEGMLDRKISRR